ncbi:chorismate binding enzyme [Desulfovibrio desulfuricans]|uniref:Chorismate binding enzyme n=1 Tax=Desulfovibrio desulfuricans TaxID=876 RepID=A0AA94HS07_DESDE|nr:chorismate-binding protein [Desulfovibrio desulfuricans]SFW36541.1 chorismate binding enzyme [Desulfovibrio desulfuricans]
MDLLYGDFTGQKSLLGNGPTLRGLYNPTPAVGGVPAGSALAFLRDHEGFDRGWYAGPVGWLDAEGNGEFMVALRSGVIQGNEAVLFAGCGLVAGSDPEKEYQETWIKFSTMLNGLCPAQGAEFVI